MSSSDSNESSNSVSLLSNESFPLRRHINSQTIRRLVFESDSDGENEQSLIRSRESDDQFVQRCRDWAACVEEKVPVYTKDLQYGGQPNVLKGLGWPSCLYDHAVMKAVPNNTYKLFPRSSEFENHFNWSTLAFRRYDHFMRICTIQEKDLIKWTRFDTMRKLRYTIKIVNVNYKLISLNQPHNYCLRHFDHMRKPTLYNVLCTDCYLNVIVNSHDEGKLRILTNNHFVNRPSNVLYLTEQPTQDHYGFTTQEILCNSKNHYFATILQMSDILFCRICLKATFAERIESIFTKELIRSVNQETQCDL